MALFHYKAVDNNGTKTEATLEAKDRFDLYRLIKKDGLTILSTDEVKKKSAFSIEFLNSFVGGVKTHDKITFARNLGKMIEAGLPMVRCLSIMERQAGGALKPVFKSLNDSVSKGTTLSDSMAVFPNIFSTLFVSMVRAGEESGNLALSLQSVATQMEKSYQLNRKIRGAMLYPAVVLALMAVIGLLMMVYMVPTLTATFTSLNVALPLPTQLIIATSTFLQSYFILVIFGALVLALFLFLSARTDRGKRLLDTICLKLPIIGPIVKEVNSARTARALSSLLASGVDISKATNVTKDIVQNSYYKKVLSEVQQTVQKGESISTVFTAHSDLYPLFVGEMTLAGEESGKIVEMLLSVAVFYEEEVDQKTKDISSLIEPFLMIFIGLAVGFFAIAVISPIYSIGNAIN